MHLIPLDMEPHGKLPELPESSEGLTCPASIDERHTVCGAPLAFAHNVREYHAVRAWSDEGLVLGECSTIDDPDEPDPHLWCTAGHDWAVPTRVEYE